jgi:hypothetical protein
MSYKKNHYVPQFYLRHFSVLHAGDRKPLLWVYDKEDNEPRKQSPNDTAAINDLYKTSVPGLTSNALELAFGKQENIVSRILCKWKEPGAIPQIPEIRDVAYFLALLYLRNPKTAKWYETMSELVSVQRAKRVASDSDLFDKLWQTLVEKGVDIPPNLTKEQVREILLNFDDNFTVKIDPKYATFSPLGHADTIFDELKKFYWCLCTAPPGWNFITSDSPVVVRFRKGDGVAFGGGFGHPTAQVTFPISPRVCLYLSRTFRFKTVSVNSTVLKNVNRRTAINAERYVFASQLSEGIEKLIKKYSFTRKQPRLDKAEMIENIKIRALARRSRLPE